MVAGAPQINVSYHMLGTGHFVDVWKWLTPVSLAGPGGIVPAANYQLSCHQSYSRISMDSHKSYGTTVVWEDSVGGNRVINVIAANQNNFGPVFALNGTVGHQIPDVAFTHSNSTASLDIHIVSWDPGASAVFEYFVNWPNIIPGGPNAMACGPFVSCATCPLPIAIEDVSPLAAMPNSLHIDAPDHYTVSNWAYTYEIANDIYARIMNFNPGGFPMPSFFGIPATVCFTNGSYVAPVYPPGLATINTSVNNLPVIAWNQQPMTNPSFYVAWHTAFNDAGTPYNPTSDAYIAIQIAENGFVVNPAAPFSFMGASINPANISPVPTIALSKHNEGPFLYETFTDLNSLTYEIRNRFVPWSAGQFKPGSNTAKEEMEITVSPNPFKNDLRIHFPDEVETETVKVRVTDIAGREYSSYDSPAYGANAFLGKTAAKLIPGNYLINVECPKLRLQKVFKVTKTD